MRVEHEIIHEALSQTVALFFQVIHTIVQKVLSSVSCMKIQELKYQSEEYLLHKSHGIS